MVEIQADNSYAEFCTTYVRAVIAWNNAEAAARDILSALSQGGIGAKIAIYQLGNVSLGDALSTVAQFLKTINSPLAAQQSEHIDHFRKGLDILRVYRNFYVHDIRSIHDSKDSTKCAASLWSLDVKQGYSFVSHVLTLEEVSRFTSHCSALQDYGQSLQEAISGQPRSGLLALGPQPTPLASLQKPKWPEKLKKSRSNLLEQNPPPQS